MLRRALWGLVVGALVGWTATMIYLAVRPQVLLRDDDRPVRVGLGQKHSLVSLHKRRQPSWQLTWNAPDSATGYTVYVTRECPRLICNAPRCTINPDGGPDGSPVVVGACSDCAGASAVNLDAGTCTCLDDGGRPTCNNGAITGAQIDAGACSNPALCCVSYPGTPAPAGQHDGIIVSQCYASATPDSGPIQTDGGRCCVHGACWYPPPNFPLDGGGIGTLHDASAYSGTCWMPFYIENGYGFDVEAH